MADIADQASEYEEQARNAALSQRLRGYTLPKGESGTCEHCGEHSPRLVDGRCAPCRDRLGIG